MVSRDSPTPAQQIENHLPQTRSFVLFVPDGAADLDRSGGLSPLASARTPNADFLAREGVSGLMQTLYPDLPRESMVAQLGMLGWDPHRFYPHGRSSCELLALDQARLGEGDLAFRANLVQMSGPTLVSYSADFITSRVAGPLVARVDRELRRQFPEFELYHNADFRNTLVVRGAGIDPRRLVCPEPHENHGVDFALARLISGVEKESQAFAERVNQYLVCAAELLASEPANALFPWSASWAFVLPPFAELTGFPGRVAVIGFMDFLKGIARAGGMDFVRLGNGRPDTDYQAKGEMVVELLAADYGFVVCHVNAPDEASHMGNRQMKVETLEAFDQHVLGPAVAWFRRHPEHLGGVMLAPDHYTNHRLGKGRAEAHSLHPVPFSLWNGVESDGVQAFSEDEAAGIWQGREPMSHLDLLRILGVAHP
jgi:2,3-bisphosphoglycerate-independent phosphoglycerate mutase